MTNVLTLYIAAAPNGSDIGVRVVEEVSGAAVEFTVTTDMLARLDRELLAERTRVDRQRAEDRETEADRLERIETDIRAMRDLMFEAFQRGRTD